MAYSDFDLKRALTDFALTNEEGIDLFPAVAQLEPSETLRAWLAEFVPVGLGLGSERGRGETIIFPILAEAKRRSPQPVTIAPGVTFEVDRARGLTGVCDYLLTRSREVRFVRGPVLAVVEAKRDDITGGLGQCVAEMVAVRLFNETEGTPRPVVYGCVTTGNIWQFVKLEGPSLFIDRSEYYIHDLPKVLGILVQIVSS
ncbi:MAG: hypothetical protein K2P78_03795 [Gemmataceae bacterium]|nr:hypothetical protein [Gemmataceae bacterium]